MLFFSKHHNERLFSFCFGFSFYQTFDALDLISSFKLVSALKITTLIKREMDQNSPKMMHDTAIRVFSIKKLARLVVGCNNVEYTEWTVDFILRLELHH